jgi:DNA polymerase-3 subunit beta
LGKNHVKPIKTAWCFGLNLLLLSISSKGYKFMKFSLDRAALLRALNHVQSVVERRSTIPILSNVLLKAEDGMLSLSTTDMDVEMSESIAADVSKAGATTAPAVTLHDIVRKLPDTSKVQIELDASGNFITVKAGRSDFRLSVLPVADFPQFAAAGGAKFPTQFTAAAGD